MTFIRTDNILKAEVLNEIIRGTQVGKRRYHPMSIGDLRDKLPNISKEKFDEALLSLSEDGVITLFGHDFAVAEKAEKREKFLKVGSQYFHDVTIRQ